MTTMMEQTDEDVRQEIGARIVSYRQGRHVSQRELAKQCGRKRNGTLSLYERGMRDIPYVLLLRIAEALDVPLAVLLSMDYDAAVRARKIKAKFSPSWVAASSETR